MGPERRRLYLRVTGAVALAATLTGVAVWKLLGPARLGLDQPRVVLASGQATADGAHVRAAQALAPGATLATDRGGICVSIHASRACLGANSVAQLTVLGNASATLKASHGTFLVGSVRDVLTVVMPSVKVQVAAATIALEEIGAPHTTLRVLEGNATVQADGRPDLVVAAPEVINLSDGSKGASSPPVETEERGIIDLAKQWQGSAGAVVDVENTHGRVELDGAYVGVPPATVLVPEGNHALVVRDTAREITHESLTLAAGQTLVR